MFPASTFHPKVISPFPLPGSFSSLQPLFLSSPTSLRFPPSPPPPCCLFPPFPPSRSLCSPLPPSVSPLSLHYHPSASWFSPISPSFPFHLPFGSRLVPWFSLLSLLSIISLSFHLFIPFSPQHYLPCFALVLSPHPPSPRSPSDPPAPPPPSLPDPLILMITFSVSQPLFPLLLSPLPCFIPSVFHPRFISISPRSPSAISSPPFRLPLPYLCIFLHVSGITKYPLKTLVISRSLLNIWSIF